MPAKEAPKKTETKKSTEKTVVPVHHFAVGLKKGHPIQKREIKKSAHKKGVSIVISVRS
jgi:hypothetical protein